MLKLNVMYGKWAAGTLKDGNPIIISMKGAPIPATIGVTVTAGDIVSVYYSIDDQLSWVPWSAGSVSLTTGDILTSGITHAKFQRISGSSITSSYGVC